MLLALALSLQLHALPTATLDALRADDCHGAVSAGGPPEGDAERLALARCLLVIEETGRALRHLGSINSAELDGYRRLLTAEALVTEGRYSAALEQVQSLSLPGPAAERLAMVRARALFATGSLLPARDALRPLLKTPLGRPAAIPSPYGVEPGEVRWMLAEGAIARGSPDLAIPVWESIWSHNPGSPWEDKARAALTAAGRTVPDPTSWAGKKRITERIDTLGKQHRYKEALALRDLLPQTSSSSKPSATAMAAFKARDYPRAVELWSQTDALGPDALFHKALAMSRTGDYPGAAAEYTRLFRSYPDHSRADQASYKVGYLAYDGGDLEDCVERFAEHLTRYPRSRHADEARWFSGWALYKLDRLPEADAQLTALGKHHPKSSLSAAARYWRARIVDRTGDSAAAADGYSQVIRSYPLSGYAWMAAHRIGRTWDPPEAPAIPALPAALQTEAFTAGAALADAGLIGWADAELAPIISTVTGRDGALAMGHALVAAGRYQDAQALAKPYCGRPQRRDGDQAALQLCWPRPMGETIARHARAGGLDPNLPFAIMLAESALQPGVTSPAGARGLMQMMPNLAGEWYSRIFPAGTYHPDRLYHPGTNARLGVAELSALRERYAAYAEPLPMVIAAYNAGTEAVDRWLAAAEEPVEPDRFTEDIGYTETRRYVRRVLGYLQIYRYVYGDG